jgi:formylglycine-generating enzyme required for sulfatase activity
VPDAGSARRVSLGSTPQEIEAALALCRAHRPDCRSEWYDSEGERSVELRPYTIDPHEVTNREFARFAEETGHVSEAERRGLAYVWNGTVSLPVRGASWRAPAGPGSSHADRPDAPVVNVVLADAEAFCRWRGARLPSEDEWELAARSEARRVFPWGEAWDPARASWAGSEPKGPRPVGSFAAGATPGGVFDLAGNVWEWTSSRVGEQAVLKGGSFAEANPANLRAATQRLEDPDSPQSDDGFRCANDAGEWLKAPEPAPVAAPVQAQAAAP